MGNKNSQGLPSVIVKNWYQLQENSDVFKSKLTSECVREHTVRIIDTQKIQQFKLRMKETSPYICRVAFYYHLSDDIYHVYTDQNRNRPFVHNLDEWKVHKQHIVQSFLYLSRKYGNMNVCNQMIGVDFNGQIKVWINPDPLSNFVWSNCSSQTEMISDILTVCRLIEEESQSIKKKNLFQEINSLSNKKILNHKRFNHSKNNGTKNNEQNFKHSFPNFTPKKAKQSSFHKNDEKNDEQFKNADYILNSDAENQRIEIQLFQSGDIQHASNPQTPTQQQPISWVRTKTQNFGDPPLTKTRRCSWADNYIKPSLKFFRLNKQIKQQKQYLDAHILKQKLNFQQKQPKNFCGANSERNSKTHQKGGYDAGKTLYKQENSRFSKSTDRLTLNQMRKISRSTDRLTLNQIKKIHARKCLSIEKNIQNQQNFQFVAKQSFVPLKRSNHKISKFSNKLVNVANIPVKEERESQTTFIEFQEEVKSQQKKVMTISQEFINFFDQQEKREYGQIKQKIMTKAIIYEDFHNQVNSLLSDN